MNFSVEWNLFRKMSFLSFSFFPFFFFNILPLTAEMKGNDAVEDSADQCGQVSAMVTLSDG